jgi:penicillin-binding protein 2
MSGDDPRRRLGLLAVTALSLFAALLARLWFLQVVEGDKLELQASSNATRVVIIPAPRGRIFDRNGVPLVDNRESIVAGVDLQKFGELSEREQGAMLARLAAALNRNKLNEEPVTVASLRKRLNDGRFSRLRPIPVAEDISEVEEIYFAEQADRYPSLVVERTTVRTYPHGSLAAHLLGYVGPLSDAQWAELKDHNDPRKPYLQSDEIGKAGVESTYERYLRGTPGRQVFEVDRSGRVVREIASRRVAPKPGDDLYLSIDARVQAETEISLRSGLADRRSAKFPSEAGAAAVVDPANGQVTAMASYPTYDPTELVGGISCPTWRDLQGLDPNGSCGAALTRELEDREDPPVAKLLNRAIQGTYPAGSTFKLASAYAGLKLGLIYPEKTLVDPGYYLIPGCNGTKGCRVSSPSAENGGVGTVDLRRALTVSSDTYFYKLGNDSWAAYKQDGRVGPTAFQDQVRTLGFGAKTGIDLPSESAGRIPDPQWLAELDKAINGKATDAGHWGSGNSINMAIGQGDVLVTPLQLANAYAAFANGGTLYQPSVLDKITEAGRPDRVVLRYQPRVLRHVDWGPARTAMLEGFEGVTRPNDGYATAATAFSGFPQDTWSAAGKTGTAQTGTKKHPKQDHSWFVGFGPSRDARYCAAVIMEHAGAGGSASAPAVRRVFEVIADGQLDTIDLSAVASPLADGTEDTTSAAQQGSG